MQNPSLKRDNLFERTNWLTLIVKLIEWDQCSKAKRNV